MRFRFSIALALWAIAAPGVLRAETHPIDAERSKLTIFVYKSGLFSAFADDHIIQASIASGSVSPDEPFGVEVAVRTRSLVVLDPKLAAPKRADVQARMLGPEVLDSTKYPDIAFASTAIESTGPNRWMVRGRLTIHGVTRQVGFQVAEEEGRYRGTAMLKQRDFGIEPISIAGGTVKVKDELKVEFEIVTLR